MTIRDKGRRLAINLAILVVTLAITLVIAEVLVRFFMPQYYFTTPPGEMLEPGEVTRLRPGFQGRLVHAGEYDIGISINSLGLRGPETSVAKPEGVYRVLVLGDSFTFGFGVEADQSFVALLGESLKADGLKVETLNAGVPGTGPTNSLPWLEKYGLQLEPDLVLLGVCLANDLLDANMSVSELPKWQTPHWLYHRSHLFRLIARHVPPGMRSALGLSDSVLGTYDVTFGGVYFRQMITRYADDLPVTKEAKQLNRAALDGFVTLGEQHDFRFAAFLIPSLYNLLDEPWEMTLRMFDLSPDTYKRTVPIEFFRRELSERGIPTLDLSAQTLDYTKRGEKLFFDDGHWSVLGNQMAAKALHDFVLEKDLLAPSKEDAGEDVIDHE